MKKQQTENLSATDDELVDKPVVLKDEVDLAEYKSFRGIGNVKSADDEQMVSPEDAAYFAKEILKCKEDPVYFAEKYFYIISFKGKQLIELYDKQKEMLNNYINYPFSITLSQRQGGKCVTGKTKITVRNKKTKKIEQITISELLQRHD